MPMATMGALEIYYEKTSCPNQETATAGRRLLFIGGSGGDLRREPNVFGGPLASTFELLSYDQRGLGRSEIPDPPTFNAFSYFFTQALSRVRVL